MTLKNGEKSEEELTCHFKIDIKNLRNFDSRTQCLKNYLTKLYNVWAKKVQRSYVWLHSRLIQSLKENWLVFPKIDMRNMANFHQSTWKSPYWDLDDILLSKVENVYMNLSFTGELCVMTMKKDVKIEEELICQFKIDMRNLTNFDPSTRKPQKFAL